MKIGGKNDQGEKDIEHRWRRSNMYVIEYLKKKIQRWDRTNSWHHKPRKFSEDKILEFDIKELPCAWNN